MAKKVKEDLSEIPETVEQTGTVPEKAGLNLSDIRSCVSIIDIVTKRGAFEGSELESVGGVRNRLAAFIDSHGPQETEGATATDEAGDPVEVEEV